jgi:hypothetical protein
MSKTFSKTIDKNFDVSSFLDFFFIVFSGVSQRLEFKNTTNKCFTKEVDRKAFYEKSDQKPKTDFSSIYFNQVFGRFSVTGVQKHDTKMGFARGS